MTRPTRAFRQRHPWRSAFATALSLALLVLTLPLPAQPSPPQSAPPPPRSIDDITAILDQQKREQGDVAPDVVARAEAAPPATGDAGTLIDFYLRRGQAASALGRSQRAIADLTEAARLIAAHGAGSDREFGILTALHVELRLSGNDRLAIETVERAIARAPASARGRLLVLYSDLARYHRASNDLDEAERALSEARRFYDDPRTWTEATPTQRARWDASLAGAQAAVLELRGRFDDAAVEWRRGARALDGDSTRAGQNLVDIYVGRAAVALAVHGQLLEAETEARRALLGALRKNGRYSSRTANSVLYLTRVMLEQGRYDDAERLARATIEIFEKIGGRATSAITVTEPRRQLARALVGQRRWADALAEYESYRAALSDEDLFQRLALDPNYVLVLLKGGRLDEAARVARRGLENRQRVHGPAHWLTGELRGLLAMAEAAQGDSTAALSGFAAAAPILLEGRSYLDEDEAGRAARDLRFESILEAYLDLLVDTRGTRAAREARIDAVALSFRIADAARGRLVQRALDAAALRSAATTPALAERVRRHQDAQRAIDTEHRRLARLLAQPTDQQHAAALGQARDRLDQLKRVYEQLGHEIAREFPAYGQWVASSGASLDQARAALRPGEALVTTYTTSTRTFVWAVPHRGDVAFAAVSLPHGELADLVERVRRGVDPGVGTAAHLPAFDLAAAHEIYARLLLPVRSGWQRPTSLLVVPHGPLAHVPPALLVTRPTASPAGGGARAATYRDVAWLVRTHAVSILPSARALVTLRSRPAARTATFAFAGFGDPLFSREQAEAAGRDALAAPATGRSTGDSALRLRNVPRTEGQRSASLADLPRLPETGEEILGIGRAMGADSTRDVFLRERASEHMVQTVDLARYRVLAFATHGLVPGELDGLAQPALALTAPDVAGGDGDGLLTVDDILALRLDAEWVVLSACNTAAGQGAGAEAISGLGRAFFYAGARALLVSNWPVETTSAHRLMTDLFSRHIARGLTRAEALRRAMNAMIDGPGLVDRQTGKRVVNYAHPLFWAPFTLVGDGGRSAPTSARGSGR